MKSPAYQHYPKDYLTSARVALMTLEQEGCYRRMLDYCWLGDSLPNNLEKIAQIVGKGASTTLVASVVDMFEIDKSNPELLRHSRLDAEMEKQRKWSEKSKIGGKRSGIARRKWLKGGSKMVEPNTNIASPSPEGDEKGEFASHSPSHSNGDKPLYIPDFAAMKAEIRNHHA